MEKVKEGYKMTQFGEIPNSWKVEKIGNIFDFYGGISISRDKQSENGVYYLHYGDIHKKNRNYFSVKEDSNWLPKIEIDINDLKEGILLNTGDVVFADASEDYEGIGKSVVIINEKNEDFVSGLHTIVAKDKCKELDTLYKKYCFGTTEVRKQFRTLATGATVYGISRSNIKDIKILVPTIEEQEQIALTLSSVDEQIEITDNLIEKTKEFKKGLMQKLLTKGIGHSRFKDTEIGKIPEEWEVYSLKALVQRIIVGLATSVTKYYREVGTPIIRNLNIKKGYFDGSDMLYLDPTFAQEQSSKQVKTNDVLTVHTGSNLGLACLVPQEYDSAQTFTTLITTTKSDKLIPQYLVQHINSNIGISEIERLQVGGGKNNLNVKDFQNYRLALPSIEEQVIISNLLSSLDEQIEQYQFKKQKLQELKKGLMQKILTGSIRVKV